jgi:hypothetical protein
VSPNPAEVDVERSAPLAVGWQVVPDEPPGTFAWWNGERHVAIAFWTGRRWEFVTDDWSGSDPPPGALPVEAATPAAHGWIHTPDGRWQHVEFIPADPQSEPLPPIWRDIGLTVAVAVASVLVGLALAFALLFVFAIWVLSQMNGRL